MPAEGIVAAPVTGADGALWCLRDGAVTFPAAVFAPLTGAEIAARLDAAGATAPEAAFNAFLFRGNDGALTLIDAGCGAEMGAQGGALPGRLAALGIAPGDISRLVLTHLHGDHCGGALDGDVAVFPNAEILLHPAEDAWAKAQDRTGARFLRAYGDRVVTVEEGAVICPGLSVWAPSGRGHIRGHTPGHIGLCVGTDLVIAGDILHAEALQLADPDVSVTYDEDPAEARASRWAALSTIARGGLRFSGGHVLGPDSFARLTRAGDGFTKVAA
ncbi:MBL fold metallo-hydrolase [Jannaschia sp. M317]|uniref:MBL fold metallo-hydrolase n=1 Tax=Jannaschia sp. M317 TaxID=2867011 RepID=UPI0021A96E36|nr:MBL fold metallo-hydrolase [Jannaschia sp. M317]UWQ16521.1 MBL fold metallo-hydrolase [Jannaschia sp. M317]